LRTPCILNSICKN